MQQNKTKTLVTCGMLIALASILSIFPKIDGIWPNGGSITFCSMLPIIIISYLYGLKWGFMSSFAFALIQLFTGIKGIASMDALTTFGNTYRLYNSLYNFGHRRYFQSKFNNPAKNLPPTVLWQSF